MTLGMKILTDIFILLLSTGSYLLLVTGLLIYLISSSQFFLMFHMKNVVFATISLVNSIDLHLDYIAYIVSLLNKRTL
jgi:uncharacterized membrane protein